MKLSSKIAKLNFDVRNKFFQIYNDGILRAPRKWWQHIYIIYHWTIFEQVLFLVNFATALAIGIYSFVNPASVGTSSNTLNYIIATVSLVGNVTDIMSIILSSKKRISTFTWGVIACGTLGVSSLLMGAVGTGIVYVIVQLPMQFIGFYLWRRQSVNKIQVEPKKMKWWMILLFVTIILALTTGFYFLEKMPSFQEFWNGYSDQIQDSPVVWFCDSLDLVLGTAGMILMVMVFKEQWIIWIILDITMIVLFSVNTQPQMIALAVTSLINSIYGVWNWRHETKLKDYE